MPLITRIKLGATRIKGAGEAEEAFVLMADGILGVRASWRRRSRRLQR